MGSGKALACVARNPLVALGLSPPPVPGKAGHPQPPSLHPCAGAVSRHSLPHTTVPRPTGGDVSERALKSTKDDMFILLCFPSRQSNTSPFQRSGRSRPANVPPQILEILPQNHKQQLRPSDVLGFVEMGARTLGIFSLSPSATAG